MQLIMKLKCILITLKWTVLFFSKVYYLKTHYVVRSSTVGWSDMKREHRGPSSLPRGDFMMSLQALEKIHLLLSHESVLRILSMSPNKNLSVHWLCHSALYLIWEWCFWWPSRHAVPWAPSQEASRGHPRGQCHGSTGLMNNSRWWQYLPLMPLSIFY